MGGGWGKKRGTCGNGGFKACSPFFFSENPNKAKASSLTWQPLLLNTTTTATPVTIRLCLCFTTPPRHRAASSPTTPIDARDVNTLLGRSTTSFSRLWRPTNVAATTSVPHRSRRRSSPDDRCCRKCNARDRDLLSRHCCTKTIGTCGQDTFSSSRVKGANVWCAVKTLE